MFDGFSAPEAFGTKGGETRDVEAAVWELPDEQIRLQSNTILLVGHRAGPRASTGSLNSFKFFPVHLCNWSSRSRYHHDDDRILVLVTVRPRDPAGPRKENV